MKSFLDTLKKAVIVSLTLMVLCGFVFPVVLTGVSQLIFSKQANGNMIKVNGQAVGSELVGQQFTDDKYFKGRVSSVNYNTYVEGDTEYGGVSSGSFNYGASNPDLLARVEADMEAFLIKNPDIKMEDIPADLMTASGSGLDPHVSIKSAMIQIPAIARASGLTEEALKEMVENNIEKKVFGVFGEDKVNILKLNLEVADSLGILK